MGGASIVLSQGLRTHRCLHFNCRVSIDIDLTVEAASGRIFERLSPRSSLHIVRFALELSLHNWVVLPA